MPRPEPHAPATLTAACPVAPALDEEVARIGRLEAVHKALHVLRRTTGMRVALVARVTEESWTACAMLDDIGFGLKPGDHVDLRNTY